MGEPHFKICSWRTNDSKNDLSIEELMDFCEQLLAHQKKINGDNSGGNSSGLEMTVFLPFPLAIFYRLFPGFRHSLPLPGMTKNRNTAFR
jgi:hypothetical protein